VDYQDLLVFHSSKQDCAFPLDVIQEIVPMTQLSSPPGMPSLLAGFLDLGGFAVAIIRLDKLFNLPEQRPGLHTPLIILRGQRGGRTGVLVGGVRRIVKVARPAFMSVPPGNLFCDCATAVIDLDGTPVHILSPDRILLEKESQILAEFQSIEQERLEDLREAT